MKQGLAALALTVCVMACGCGSSMNLPKWPDPIKAGGTVTMDGTPLQGGVISFAPLAGTEGTGGIGTIDESGKYEMRCRTPDGKTKYGIFPGKYRVTFSRMVRPNGELWTPDASAPGGPMNFGAREMMPPEYTIGSKLTVDIAEGKEEYDFNLKKK